MAFRSFAAAFVAAAVCVAFTGCDDGIPMGQVSGTITVDGQVPALGSSITFIPSDGKTPSTGCTLDAGKYSAKVPVGKMKVEIRVPKPVAKPEKTVAGPGAGGDKIDESLPAKYNSDTELTYEVVSGSQTKDFVLTR